MLYIYIDLDVVITGDLSYIQNFLPSFGILNTEDIFCEVNSSDGYNSSVVLWKGFAFEKIYDLLIQIKPQVMKYLFRFDFWLEMLVDGAFILQNEFPGQIKDFCQQCTSEKLPEGTSIVIFPRNPKPHECSQAWIKQFWI